MIHRLGMYYLAVQLQHDQDADAARQKRREGADRPAVADPEDLTMLVRASAAIAAAISAVALVLWAAA
jgi:hypothetical protein